jgi:prepilin-type N-terminal cleavage/methylation domain-containing protein
LLRSGPESIDPARAPGFTLLEVMIGLALLGLALTVLIKSTAGDIFNAQQAHMMGVATDLARGKMYELEEKLIKDGFSDTEQSEDDRPFEDEGWPQVTYSYKIEEVELPSWDQLQAIANGRGSGSGSGSASGSAGSDEGGFQNSALGGMLSQFSGFGGMGGGGGSGGKPGAGGDIDSAVGASFIQGQYQMFQQILKVTIRKVTLTLKWKVMGSDRDMKVVAFFTDSAAMDKVINGMGSQELPAAGSGSGSGSGSGNQGGGEGGGRGSGSSGGGRGSGRGGGG